jgi:hypothetical protein
MKYFYTCLTIIASLFIGSINAQTGNIRFTAKKNPSQANQILIYGKNFSGSPISGILGSSNITLCVIFPSSASGTPSITSPISGQLFEAPLNNLSGGDSVYSWNGKGATSSVDFPADGTTEVLLATVTFNTGAPGVTATVKIADIAAAGPSGFDYCYIAPGGVEQSGYSNPFYSNISSDPLLINSGGVNDPFSMAVSSLGISSVALPVKFLGFNVIKKNNDGLLTWQIENESSTTDRYEIERSLNGVDFKKVYSVAAKNNGRSSNSYDLTDLNLPALRSAGIFYYRIKQVDKDGKFLYTGVKNLRLTTKSMVVAIYPNPIKNFANLTIDLVQDANATVTINDASGKQIQNIEMSLFKGANIKKINMGTLAAGSYILQVQTADQTETIPVVKIN